jgi:transposase InsO family protein
MNNPHKNARTCVYSREQIVVRYDNGQSAAEIARSFGISVRTVFKWLQRFRNEGATGLTDRSSRPHHNAHAYVDGWKEMIVKLRGFRMTALEIAGTLKLPRSTISLALVRYGLNRLDRLTPPEPVRRYEREHPGDLIHLDIKKLGRFLKPGHRVTGWVGRQRSKGLGYDYVHVAIDDHSRVAYVEVLEDEKGETCARFLERATQWFGSKGVKVNRVMTDNGVGYISHVFRDTAIALGQRHIRTKPYTPKTNGKAERFIKTLQEEWAYGMPFKSHHSRNAWLPKWLHIYNCERPHGGINMKTPISRLKPKP